MRIYNIYSAKRIKYNIIRALITLITIILFPLLISYMLTTKFCSEIAVVLIIFVAYNIIFSFLYFFYYFIIRKNNSNNKIAVDYCEFNENKIFVIDAQKNKYKYTKDEINTINFDIETRRGWGGYGRGNYISYVKLEIFTKYKKNFYLYFCKKTIYGNMKTIFNIIDCSKLIYEIQCKERIGGTCYADATCPEIIFFIKDYEKQGSVHALKNRIMTYFKALLEGILFILFCIFIFVIIIIVLYFLYIVKNCNN